MKKLHWIFSTAALLSGLTFAQAQTQSSTIDPEVPGDNFSLEGALELFKKSASPEEFERMLNSSNSKVNNLDLNGDGNIDYIRVIDRNEGNVHAFIMQAVISQTENQDIAVIELQKLENGKAVLQITGDADIYGIETIIEPSEEVRVYGGTTTVRNVVNVWSWPAVQYVYAPYYNPWVSPWSWSYYPMWWHSWTPVAYYVYSPWWRPYRPYYSFCYSHRIGFLPRLYHPYRCTSAFVYNNCHRQITTYRSNYNGRTRDDGNRGRHDGRNDGGRGRYDGYGGRTRSDYSQDHSRYTSSNRDRQRDISDAGRQQFRNSDNRTDRSIDRGRSYDRSSSNFRDGSGVRQRNNDMGQQRSQISPDRSNQFKSQRNSSSLNMRGHSQRSSSMGQSSFGRGNSSGMQRGGGSSFHSGGSRHSGGGAHIGGGRSSGGGGGRSGGNHGGRGR